MNKAEIIRKISKKAGVPDTEAKKFFEIFLKNASEILKPGESIDIAGVGMFQLRVGQIENRSSHNPDQEYIYSDLLIYINKDESLTEDEEIIFNVPSGIEKEYQPVDSYFSLSIGKPVIPLKGVKETEFFIPPSGTELRSLLESKIARLIDEAEKLEGGKETETIRLNDEEEGTGKLTDWKKLGEGNTQDETRVPTRSDFMKTREFENLSWDFGENLSSEIEEDAILDFETGGEKADIEEAVPEDEPKPADFAKVQPDFEEEGGSEVQGEDIFEELIDEDESEVYFEDENEELKDSPFVKDETTLEAKTTEPDDTAATDEKYEEPSMASDEILENEIEPDLSDTKSLVQEETEPDKIAEEPQSPVPEPEEPLLKNFQRVRSLTKEFRTTEFDDFKETEENKPKRITEVRGGYQKVRRTTAEFNFDLSGIEGLDELEDEPPARKKKGVRDYQGYRKRSSVPSFIVAFVVVAALAGIIFLYFKLKSANTEVVSDKKTAQTTTIDRNYDVPVTYPYNKSGENKPAGNGTVEDKQGKNGTELKTSESPNSAGDESNEIREPVNADRIGNYIYQYPEGVVVQVSSWKSRTIALNEVRKYREAGHTAFAEKSEIQGMGLYYRVRVGFFKSLEEAENFVNGNH